MKKVIIPFLLASMSFSSHAYDDLNARDFALKKCLHYNYNHDQLENSNSINKDVSILLPRYTPEDWSNVIKFVEDNTSDYYKEVVLMHFEEGPDKAMNIIFSKCMKFYHSKKMSEFIKRNKY